MLEAYAAMIGGLTGFIVAALGIGGGAIATPALVLAGVSPLKAVGSDLAYAFTLKCFTSTLYGKGGEVDLGALKVLLVGGLIGLVASYLALNIAYAQLDANSLNRLVRCLLGASLIAISLDRLLRPPIARPLEGWWLATVGFMASALLMITSIGSGAIVVAALLGRGDPRRAIGTALTYSLTVTAIASLAHLSLNTIDPTLVALLLAPSIPMAYLGYKASRRASKTTLSRVIALALMVLGGLTLLK